MNTIEVGDLIKHTDYEQYGIVLSVMTPNTGTGVYYVVLWVGASSTDWIWNDLVIKI